MTRAVRLGGLSFFVWSHTGGFHGPIRSGRKYATMPLIGDHGEQWAPFNALVGWKRTVGTQILSSAEDLPPGVFTVASRDPVSGKVGVVFANYGWARRRARKVTVALKNLRGSYRLKRYLIDRTHSSRWGVAQDRPQGAKHNDLEMVEDRTMDVSGTTSFAVDLPVWSSTFITLEPS